MLAVYDAIGSTSRIRYAISIAKTEGEYENVDVIQWLILLFEQQAGREMSCRDISYLNAVCKY